MAARSTPPAVPTPKRRRPSRRFSQAGIGWSTARYNAHERNRLIQLLRADRLRAARRGA